MIFRYILTAVLFILFSQNAVASLTKEEVQSLSKTKILSVQKMEDRPGVYFRSYKFAKDPDFTVEVKAHYINVAWREYNDDPRYDKANAKNRQLAEEVVTNLIGSSRFVRAIIDGGTVGKIKEGAYIVSGSCTSSICLLSFDNIPE